MPKAPTISIGLCTFNGERYLREQLDSIERQTLLPYELVACDDGSTDNTMSILHDFARRAQFPVRVIQNEQRRGVSGNFAKAVSECRGDYYAPCDQDDIWLPERLETFSSLLSKHPYGLVFSDAFLIDDSSCPLNRTVWQSFGVGRREVQRIASGEALELLVTRTLVTGATMILSRELLNIGFPVPENLPYPIIQDGWLVLLASARQEIAAINRPMMFYRRHAGQQGGLPKTAASSLANRVGRFTGIKKSQSPEWIKAHHTMMDKTLSRALILRELLAQRIGIEGSWVKTWDAAIKHLEARQNLPQPFLKRLVRVLSETSAYSQFSSAPLFDMWRDIVHPRLS